MLPLPQVTHRPTGGREPVPLSSVSEAWLWTMAALIARRAGAGLVTGESVPYPCEPDDIVRILDRLYRRRRIELSHARILRQAGEAGEAPDPSLRSCAATRRLWDEAMDLLEPKMREPGPPLRREPSRLLRLAEGDGAWAPSADPGRAAEAAGRRLCRGPCRHRPWRVRCAQTEEALRQAGQLIEVAAP